MAIQGNTISVSTDTQILAGNMGIRCPEHATIDPATATEDSNGSKAFDAGHWVTRTRILPRAKVSPLEPTGSTSIVLDGGAQRFVVGDVLVISVPYDYAVFTGSWAINDTVVVNLGGYEITVTVTAPTNLAAIANIIAAVEADPYLNSKIEVKTGVAGELYILSKDGTAYSYSLTETTAGTGAIAENDTQLNPDVSVGTISAIDVSTNTLTLTGATTVPLPEQSPVGVAGQAVLGLLLNGIDLIEESEIRGVCVAASVYRDRLPYTDAVLEAQFPEIVMVDA